MQCWCAFHNLLLMLNMQIPVKLRISPVLIAGWYKERWEKSVGLKSLAGCLGYGDWLKPLGNKEFRGLY